MHATFRKHRIIGEIGQDIIIVRLLPILNFCLRLESSCLNFANVHFACRRTCRNPPGFAPCRCLVSSRPNAERSRPQVWWLAADQVPAAPKVPGTWIDCQPPRLTKAVSSLSTEREMSRYQPKRASNIVGYESSRCVRLDRCCCYL